MYEPSTGNYNYKGKRVNDMRLFWLCYCVLSVGVGVD